MDKIDNKIIDKIHEFDKFITRITDESTPEHQNIYEHWADFKYDVLEIISERDNNV